MKKMFFGVLAFVIATYALTTPAFATSHNAVHASNWLEQLLFFGVPGLAIALTYLRQQKLLLTGALLAFFGPVIWGVYRVASMDGPWNYVHFAKHHAEVGLGGAVLAAAMILLALVMRPNRHGSHA